MTWRELRSRIDASLRDDTEILGMRVRGDVKPATVIVWMTPRTLDPAVHTVGIVMSPEFGDRR